MSIGLSLHLGDNIAGFNANLNPLLILRWFKELSSRDSWKAVLLLTPSWYGGDGNSLRTVEKEHSN